jgi:hypothetical protein
VARSWLTIRVELTSGMGEDLHPAPGRVIVVGPRHSFADFAEAIDAAFARWDLSHLHEFHLADGRCIGAPDHGWDDGRNVPLLDERKALVSRTVRLGESFRYVFDLGDSWIHRCSVGSQKVDPLDVAGTVPAKPVSIWGWGAIPDQYGRRWDGDGDESPMPERVEDWISRDEGPPNRPEGVPGSGPFPPGVTRSER